MPVVTIEIVGAVERTREEDLAQSLADAVGDVFRSPPGQTWVRVRSLARDGYAENAAPVDASGLPVFVTILKRQAPGGAQLLAEVAAVTEAIAQVIGRPASCVHVEYAPSAAGRLAFGGTLVQ